MEIKVLKNTNCNRIILVDKKTGQAFVSFSKESPQYKFFAECHKEIIENFKPKKL